MREDRIALSHLERERLKVLHEVNEGHIKEYEAADRLGLSARQVRRMLGRIRCEGDRGLIHRLRGQQSNRKLAAGIQESAMNLVRRRYTDFGPTLASEQLGRQGLQLSRETLRNWMIRAEL